MLGMKCPSPDRKPEHTTGDVNAAMVGLVRALAHSAARVWLRRHVNQTCPHQRLRKESRPKAGKTVTGRD